jgi:hypothetical protein
MNSAPSFALASPPAARASRSEKWVLALLLLGLLLQTGWQQRGALAANARLRPLLETACAALHCPLPAWHEPAAFSMLSRDVIAPPNQPGVLRVQASFRNDARWPQAWPALVLRLTDVNGRSLGTRRFLPADYLGKAPHAAQIDAQQASQIAFDIVEPAPNVVAFDFRFE